MFARYFILHWVYSIFHEKEMSLLLANLIICIKKKIFRTCYLNTEYLTLVMFVAFAWLAQTVVFCLVDIYIMLGKAFLPYLEGLNSTQLRLVTIYANRISQARTGSTIDASQ